MATPTPNNPLVVNADGSVTMLVFQGRTLELIAVHKGLMDATGYKARLGLTDKYGNALIAQADSTAGSITFSDAFDPDAPLVQIGTRVTAVITDEVTELITAKAGKFDLVLEEPGGKEIPLVVGDWLLWKRVTP